jgi:excisionase family DNA binding protein
MTGSGVKTATEAAERLGVNVVTVKRWARGGTMQAIRRRPWLFTEDEVERRRTELLEEARRKFAHLADGEAS